MVYKALMVNVVLRNRFGLNEFRPFQSDVIRAILSGRDVLAILPTGSGKSLCYQLPALLLDGITVVVTPLIELMNDQCRSLEKRGIVAARIHSGMSDRAIRRVLDKLAKGQIKIVYVAPERLETTAFLAAIAKVKVALVAIDEAHCISEWGHNFRPSFLRIPQFCRSLGYEVRIAAFTATAPVVVKDDIVAILGLENHVEFIADVTREEITNEVKHFDSVEDKDRWLFRRLKEKHGPTIVYCSRVKSVERLHAEAQARGISAAKYHAQMDTDAREHNARLFFEDRVDVIFATNALGMGIDKSNIRLVIHYELTDSLGRLVQEFGRAGRDGEPAVHILLFQPHDVTLMHRQINVGYPPVEYVWRTYRSLAGFLHEEQADDENPTIYFDRAKFIEGHAHDNYAQERMTQAALGALQEYRLIETTARSLTFLGHLSMMDREAFPISKKTMEARKQMALLQLKVLLQYVYTPQARLKEVIQAHFRHNSVVNEVEDREIKDCIQVSDKVIKAILFALLHSDYIRGSLAYILASRMKRKEPGAGALKRMTGPEVTFYIGCLEGLGLIRPIPSVKQTIMSITNNGLDWLAQHSVTASIGQTYAELKLALHHPRSKDIIAAALTPWFEAAMTGGPVATAESDTTNGEAIAALPVDAMPVNGDGAPADGQAEVVSAADMTAATPAVSPSRCIATEFLATKFEIGGETVTGQRLAIDFFRCTREAAEAPSRAALAINYYMNNRLSAADLEIAKA